MCWAIMHYVRCMPDLECAPIPGLHGYTSQPIGMFFYFRLVTWMHVHLRHVVQEREPPYRISEAIGKTTDCVATLMSDIIIMTHSSQT